MLISVGLELNNEDRALAWALDYPGCFAYGLHGPEAMLALTQELAAYQEWVNRHKGPGSLTLTDLDLRVEDIWQVYAINDQFDLAENGSEINAWFRHDWKPLTANDIERGLDLLRWTREDLQRVITTLDSEQLDRQRPGERWGIRRIVKHIADSEWWYMQQLGLVGDGDHGKDGGMPDDTFERLPWVRERLNALLPTLEGRTLALGAAGEFWSPRKLLRRILWHEIDHRQHIEKLLIKDAIEG